MCGICGCFTKKEIKLSELRDANNALRHRGPDDSGEEIYSISGGWNVGLAQRRLSIIDLSEKAHQPMHSYNDDIIVVFNGEIYNFEKIKDRIKEYKYRSKSDTEVIVAAYLEWGVKFVDELDGMFAIALLDRRIDTLYLIRDRIGKKPLYYNIDCFDNLCFASELKALLKFKEFDEPINNDIIGRFLYKGYINSPETIFKNTYKLEPGTVLKICTNKVEKYKYWDVATRYNQIKVNKIEDFEEAKAGLKATIEDSVRMRLVSDVKVGAFLSGGYDSSLICAIAQKYSSNRLSTFSIGFNEEKYNEANYAKEIAKYIGADHKELYISEDDMFNVLDELPEVYDEPFADSSQIPTLIVSKLAKQDVTVVLSGDGGDELFGGYGIYNILQQVQKIEKGLAVVPNNNSIIDRIYNDNYPNAKTQGGVDTYINNINNILLKPTNGFFYEFEDKYKEDLYDIRRMLLDMDTYLPEDILTKVDRASMYVSLECRCPLLSKDVIDYSFRINPNMKNHNGDTKRILKSIVHDYIPIHLMDRPKMGFGVPQDKWLRGPLREMIYDYSDQNFLIRQGIFNPQKTRDFIEYYMDNGDGEKWSGNNYSRIVWAFMIFQKWYSRYVGS